jgi:hypothetical protein
MDHETEGSWPLTLPADLPRQGVLLLQGYLDAPTAEFADNMWADYEGRGPSLITRDYPVQPGQSLSETDPVLLHIVEIAQNRPVLVDINILPGSDESYSEVRCELIRLLTQKGIVVWLILAREPMLAQAQVYEPSLGGEPSRRSVRITLKDAGAQTS